MELPKKFIENMKELLTERELLEYLNSLEKKPCHGIRINHKKISTEDAQVLFEKWGLIEKWGLKKIPWISNGYFIEDSKAASAHPFYRAGLYYIQEPSAMTPARSLPLEKKDKILDMCAAPGGKATQLASKIGPEGFLLANDISVSRGKALLKNLEMAGVDNACVSAEDPKKLMSFFSEYFDKILLDAPCSGEGMFRRDPKSVGAWLEKGPDYYSKIQEELLEEAYAMLSPGGRLIYSTCTFSKEENEDQIEKLLKKHPQMQIEKIVPYEGFSKGFGSVEEAVRIFPHKMDGEGHFVCLLKKQGEKKESQRINQKTNEKLPKDAEEFLKHCSYDFSGGKFMVEKDRIYFLQKNLSKVDQIRYLRTGLLLGNMKKDRFEPAQSFAMALKKEEFDSVLDLPVEDQMVEKYLKGESFPVEEKEKTKFSWKLICTEGYPLGWAKQSASMLKNKYESAWRKQ